MTFTFPGASATYDRMDQDRFRRAVEQAVNELSAKNRVNSGHISSDRGDADVTLTPGTDDEIQRFATALTANRVVTLARGFPAAKFRIVRTGLGAFTLDVGGLKTIPAGTAAFVDIGHDGTAWRLTGYGVL